VERGEEVAIARNGQPMAKLVRITQPQSRIPGILHRHRVGRTLSTIAPLGDAELAEEGLG
jgi:antitoxin (DNA-binding transcriptional repressor) of toxin-antitoxin stability system